MTPKEFTHLSFLFEYLVKTDDAYDQAYLISIVEDIILSGRLKVTLKIMKFMLEDGNNIENIKDEFLKQEHPFFHEVAYILKDYRSHYVAPNFKF